MLTGISISLSSSSSRVLRISITQWSSQQMSRRWGCSGGRARQECMHGMYAASKTDSQTIKQLMARKTLRCLRGRARLQSLTQNYSIKKQATVTLNHLQSWCKIQNQIRVRRFCMVTEGRLRQKKLENQLKLEAKLHDFEVEWCGGSETMEEALSKIHLREEAAVKRERAMAYAFSHQWRANSGQNLGSYELGKANWGWSWMERWIAARPWESRVPVQSVSFSSNKLPNKQGNKIGKNTTSPTTKTPASANGNKNTTSPASKSTKARRLSYPAAEKQTTLGGSTKGEEASIRREQSVL